MGGLEVYFGTWWGGWKFILRLGGGVGYFFLHFKSQFMPNVNIMKKDFENDKNRQKFSARFARHIEFH